jgi:hypothetical protein
MDAFPVLGGSVQHSQSPIIAEGGAVMNQIKPAYVRESTYFSVKVGNGFFKLGHKGSKQAPLDESARAGHGFKTGHCKRAAN